MRALPFHLVIMKFTYALHVTMCLISDLLYSKSLVSGERAGKSHALLMFAL